MKVQHAVLIVDDNRLIREVYRVLLKLEGFSVEEAGNGAEALMWCLRETVDIILLDLEMPIPGIMRSGGGGCAKGRLIEGGPGAWMDTKRGSGSGPPNA